jgi:hypothetical protein
MRCSIHDHEHHLVFNVFILIHYMFLAYYWVILRWYSTYLHSN